MLPSRPSPAKPRNPGGTIWRYTNFAKYVSMLDSGSLYFARSDLFEDPFEGAVSPADLEELRSRVDTSAWPGGWAEYKDSHVRFLEQERRWLYVNSWHMNEGESAAMWDLYGRRDEAIAIQSTFERLKTCLPENVPAIGRVAADADPGNLGWHEARVIVGPVKYVDYVEPTRSGNWAGRLFYKRRSFAYEQEVRAVIQGWPPSTPASGERMGMLRHDLENLEPGRLVPVKLSDLIERVVVAPQAPQWFGELVESVLRKYGFGGIAVERSSLYDRPIY